MVHRWRIFGDFLGPAFPASCVQHISALHSKFALGPHHVVDIQSATAEIRRGKKEEERKKYKETTGQKYNGLPYNVFSGTLNPTQSISQLKTFLTGS